MRSHKGPVIIIVITAIIGLGALLIANVQYIQGNLNTPSSSNANNTQINRFNMRECIDAYMDAPFSDQDNRGDARRWCRAMRRGAVTNL